MSRTDKTNPWWVGAPWREDHHWRCRHNPSHIQWIYECDLPEEPPPKRPERVSWLKILDGYGNRCRWWPEVPPYYSREGERHYGRTRRVKYTANRVERGIRAAWRDCAQTLRHTPVEYLDDINLPDPRHRHFALWDEW